MIEIKNVSKTYRPGAVAVHALRNVSLRIEPGEFVAIMGPSGSGKSTLLHILGLLDRPDSGSYTVLGYEATQLNNRDLACLRNHLAGFVFQQFHLLRRVTAIENTELPLIYSGRKDVNEAAGKKLELVGLSQRKSHRPNELSGGEQQRVAIARALVNEPLIIFADEPTGNLDTKSEEEIIRILTELNDEGITIVIVTHEKEVASHARRIIRMRDGEIIEDQRIDDDKRVTQNLESRYSVEEILSKSHSSFGRRELFQHMRQSIRAISSNKARSFLSILGILFGVAAVIAMLALGQGASASIQERLKTLGSNLLSVRAGSAKVRGVAREAGSITRFTFEDVEAVRDLKNVVNRVSGYTNGSGQAVYGNENWNTRVQGVGLDYGQMRASIPEIGRWFTPEEITRREKVAIVGITIVEKLFGGRNPLGETIKINRIYFRVIGIAPEKGFGGFRDFDDTIYVPVTTALYRVFGKDYLDGIYVEVRDSGIMEEAQEEISRLIVKRHRLYKNGEDSFHIRDMSEIQEMLTSTTRTMSLLLGCIAAISLLVGGIGIMNIMLVSVTERTGEIGMRKAIGARSGDIMSQFLIEAVALTFSGGLMGILLGGGGALIMSAILGWTTKITLFSIVLSTAFSITVGICFGLWPAHKAAQLNPIDALRYE